MNIKIVTTVTVGVVMLTGSLAAAQESLRGTIMVIAKGTCSRFIVSGQNYSCMAVVYSQFKNGRVAWQVAFPEGALMLSGGRDSQLDPTKYVLQIDRIDASGGDRSSPRYPATGKCIARLSADGIYLHSLSCSATNGVEDVQLDFEGDGSPVDRKVL